MKKKLIGWLSALIMVFGTLAPSAGVLAAPSPKEPKMAAKEANGSGASVTLRVEGYGDTVLYPVTVKMPGTYKPLSEYGISTAGAEDPGYYTALHVLAQYCEDNGLDAADVIDYSGGMLQDFMDIKGGTRNASDTFLMYTLNNRVPTDPGTGWGYGIAQCPVKNGDTMVLYDMWYQHPFSGAYAYFTESTKTAVAEEAFSIQMKTLDGMTGAQGDASKAAVLVLDEYGVPLGSDGASAGITDVSGNADVMINRPGTYLLAAERMSGYYDSTSKRAYDISRPYCKVTVQAGREMTDEEVVASAKKSLTLGDVSAVTSDLNLPVSGSRKSVISWTSDKPSVISNTGRVTRPVGYNETVTLTADISKGSAHDTKTFEVTVKGYSLRLSELNVSEGAVSFDPDIRDYTVYVKEDTAQIDVTAAAEETASGVFLSVQDKKIYFDANLGLTHTVPLPADETLITVKVEKSGISKETYLTVKKAKNPGDALPDLPSEWGQHLGDKSNNAAVDAAAPTKGASLKWENFSNASNNFGSVYAGTPILVNGKVYAARNNRIEMIDTKTGKTVKSVKLKSELGYYSYPVYGEGKIFVPLGNGSIQCFNAATLESLFLTEMPRQGIRSLQGLSSVYYADGMIYAGFTNGAFEESQMEGVFAAYDTVDLDKDDPYETVPAKWTYGNASYYGSGSVQAGGYLIFAGDDGEAVSVNAKTGAVAGTVRLSGKVRSVPVYADGYVWIATQGAKLYKLKVEENGTLTERAKTALWGSTSSSPVITGGKVYITGGAYGQKGYVSVYDSNLKRLAGISVGAPANTPAVSTKYGDTYLYFTQNEPTGSLYMAKITKENRITVTKLFTPSHANYCMSKVVIGQDGTLYYYNDAGYIYALSPSDRTPDDGENAAASRPQKPAKKENILKNGLIQGKDLTRLQNAVNTLKTSGLQQEEDGESIVKALKEQADQGNTSLTVTNPPETIGKEVFEVLSKYPDFRLIIDCGSYTISILGADVRFPGRSLGTKLSEQEGTLSGEDADQMGIYQQLLFKQEGELPGKVTVVYEIPDRLKHAPELFVYPYAQLDNGTKAVVQPPYVMFDLEAGGTYILSDTKGLADTSGPIPGVRGTDDRPKGDIAEPDTGSLAAVLAGAAAVIGIGAAAGTILWKRKRRNKVWKTEE